MLFHPQVVPNSGFPEDRLRASSFFSGFRRTLPISSLRLESEQDQLVALSDSLCLETDASGACEKGSQRGGRCECS
jgi:hypothetical protein